MSDDEDHGTTKTNTIPTFNGKREKFHQWWTKFEGYANLQGFAAALKPGGEANLPDTDHKDETDDKKLKARKRNTRAVYALTMAFKAEKLQGLIHKSKTDEYENGKAFVIVQLLKDKYAPVDRYSRHEETKELAAVRMGKREDPSELTERLYTIANKYKTNKYSISKDTLLSTMIGAAPREYADTIRQAVASHGTTLDIDTLEDEMRETWRLMYGRYNTTNETNNEVALGTMSLKCYNCGKEGHKAVACPEPKRRKNRFKGKCNNCGKEGHRAADCWLIEANKDKRPAWFKVGGQTGTAAVTEDDGSVEYLLATVQNEQQCCHHYPHTCCHGTDDEYLLASVGGENHELGVATTTKFEILNDPNVWIADTGASCHSTPHAIGLTESKKADSTAGVHTASGTIAGTSVIGTIRGHVHDKEGHELNKVQLQSVHVLKQGQFNLFSITKMQRAGWTLSGNKEAIWIEKAGQTKLVFDIVIPTKTGAVYAMYIKRTESTNDQANVAAEPPTYNIQQAHDKLGHANEEATRRMAKHLG